MRGSWSWRRLWLSKIFQQITLVPTVALIRSDVSKNGAHAGPPRHTGTDRRGLSEWEVVEQGQVAEASPCAGTWHRCRQPSRGMSTPPVPAASGEIKKIKKKITPRSSSAVRNVRTEPSPRLGPPHPVPPHKRRPLQHLGCFRWFPDAATELRAGATVSPGRAADQLCRTGDPMTE